MKKLLLLLLFVCSSHVATSQDSEYENTFKEIIAQADLLYQYEKIAWNSTDLAMLDDNIKAKMGSYIIYHKKDTLYSVFVDKKLKNSIATYIFHKSNLKEPVSVIMDIKPLTEMQLQLIKIKEKVLTTINKNASKYKLNFPQGYSPNLVMVSNEDDYIFYLIMGTTQDNVIPFGNDWVFQVNSKGKITDWQKYHNSLIPAQTQGPDGQVIVSFMHSHLKMTPHISPTDICTFRLYGVDLYGFNEFKVLSTALGMSFTYNADTNKILSEKF